MDGWLSSERAAVTEAGKAGDSLAEEFFREEYTLNYTIGKLLTQHSSVGCENFNNGLLM